VGRSSEDVFDLAHSAKPHTVRTLVGIGVEDQERGDAADHDDQEHTVSGSRKVMFMEISGTIDLFQLLDRLYKVVAELVSNKKSSSIHDCVPGNQNLHMENCH